MATRVILREKTKKETSLYAKRGQLATLIYKINKCFIEYVVTK